MLLRRNHELCIVYESKLLTKFPKPNHNNEMNLDCQPIKPARRVSANLAHYCDSMPVLPHRRRSCCYDLPTINQIAAESTLEDDRDRKPLIPHRRASNGTAPGLSGGETISTENQLKQLGFASSDSDAISSIHNNNETSLSDKRTFKIQRRSDKISRRRHHRGKKSISKKRSLNFDDLTGAGSSPNVDCFNDSIASLVSLDLGTIEESGSTSYHDEETLLYLSSCPKLSIEEPIARPSRSCCRKNHQQRQKLVAAKSA